MKKIAIIGAGGFGREIKVLIDQINKSFEEYKIIGFFDDNKNLPKVINGIPVLGDIDILIRNFSNSNLNIVLGIGSPLVKYSIIKRLKNDNFIYPVLNHPSNIISDDNVNLGQGGIICAGVIITCDIDIGEFVTINKNSTIAHDSRIGEYSSIMTGSIISGEVNIGQKVYVGSGSTIINKIDIGNETIIGAGSVVIKSIISNCTVVGVPAKIIKKSK